MNLTLSNTLALVLSSFIILIFEDFIVIFLVANLLISISTVTLEPPEIVIPSGMYFVKSICVKL